jgi:hypothetical protein
MKIYVFDYVNNLTHRWHNGGGLVVVAEGPTRARELVREADGQYSGLRGEVADELDFRKAVSYQTDSSAKERLFVFQDAGCC